MLVEAFNIVKLLKNETLIKPKLLFSLHYSFKGKNYKILPINGVLHAKINDHLIDFNRVELPEKWIASSVTIYDKFPMLNSSRQKQIPEYRYLGIRSASNNAFIGKLKTDSVLFLVESLKKSKNEKLISLFGFLGFKPEVEIEFNGGIMLKFPKKEGRYKIYTKASELVGPHKLFVKNNQNEKNYRVDNYKKHLESIDKINAIYEFIQSHYKAFQGTRKSEMKLKYKVNLNDISEVSNLLNDWEIISVMLDLELIKINSFTISKYSSKFSYEEASSGENHLLSSFLGLVATLEDNSLLLIDEPEISLHPNWQIDYLEYLKFILNSYVGIHVVIASHSHLMVTSLKNEESRIITLIRNTESEKINVEELDYETYGWDPESILYNVFEVANTRNKYFELDLRNLISLISNKSAETKEIKRLIDKLERYIMPNQDDPLRLVIQQSEKYLKNLN